jgi:hypothetical protein
VILPFGDAHARAYQEKIDFRLSHQIAVLTYQKVVRGEHAFTSIQLYNSSVQAGTGGADGQCPSQTNCKIRMTINIKIVI